MLSSGMVSVLLLLLVVKLSFFSIHSLHAYVWYVWVYLEKHMCDLWLWTWTKYCAISRWNRNTPTSIGIRMWWVNLPTKTPYRFFLLSFITLFFLIFLANVLENLFFFVRETQGFMHSRYLYDVVYSCWCIECDEKSLSFAFGWRWWDHSCSQRFLRI